MTRFSVFRLSDTRDFGPYGCLELGALIFGALSCSSGSPSVPYVRERDGRCEVVESDYFREGVRIREYQACEEYRRRNPDSGL